MFGWSGSFAIAVPVTAAATRATTFFPSLAGGATMQTVFLWPRPKPALQW